jgi:hypothetical protein
MKAESENRAAAMAVHFLSEVLISLFCFILSSIAFNFCKWQPWVHAFRTDETQ